MSGLKQVLQDVDADAFKAGGVLSSRVIEQLGGYRRQQFILFVVLFAVVIGAVIFGALGLAWFMRTPTQMAAFAGAMGLSVGGAIEMLRRVWQEWSQAALLLILVEDASEAEIKSLLERLISKL